MKMHRDWVVEPSGRSCAALAAALALTVLALGATPALAAPAIRGSGVVYAPAGATISVSAAGEFDDAGTNPRFTEAVFSTLDYYNMAGIPEHNPKRLFVEVKSPAELNALASPPDSTFSVTVEVSMTNDEGEEATGTLTFQTTYTRAPSAETPSAAPVPTLSQTTPINAAPATLITVSADQVFDNAGTNPKITSAVFSDTTYYDVSRTYDNGLLYVQAKSAAELNALASPPDSPFTTTVEVTMTNDEGQTATGTLTLKTHYAKDTAEAPAPAPVLALRKATIRVPAGGLVRIDADEAFDHAGTNPRMTSAVFSDTSYYESRSGLSEGSLYVQVKSAADLNALASPPDSPFTVTVEVAMANDEGQTATGTLTFKTTYERTVSVPDADFPVDPSAPAGPAD